MKITAFLGSPRKGGNTDILAQRVIDGAKDAGLQSKSVALRRLKIRPCRGCDRCWKHNNLPCSQKDDMLPLYGLIAASDILLFATPVYWYAPTAIMKGFIDRLVPLNRPQGRPLIKGKRAILVVAYEEAGPRAVDPMLRMFELTFEWLGVQYVDHLAVDGIGPKGAILGRPRALEDAYLIGSRLAAHV